MSAKITESTIARMAGNIAAGLIIPQWWKTLEAKEPEMISYIAKTSVRLAREIADQTVEQLAEVERTQPK